MYAFDGSESAVRNAREKLRADSLTAHFEVSDGCELNYEDDFFDCIIDSATIYANKIEDIRTMYSECRRFLKCGGKLLTISFTENTYGYGMGTMLEKNTYKDIEGGVLGGRGTAHFWNKDELKKVLSDAGFENISFETITHKTDSGNDYEQFVVSCEKTQR